MWGAGCYRGLSDVCIAIQNVESVTNKNVLEQAMIVFAEETVGDSYISQHGNLHCKLSPKWLDKKSFTIFYEQLDRQTKFDWELVGNKINENLQWSLAV